MEPKTGGGTVNKEPAGNVPDEGAPPPRKESDTKTPDEVKEVQEGTNEREENKSPGVRIKLCKFFERTRTSSFCHKTRKCQI